MLFTNSLWPDLFILASCFLFFRKKKPTEVKSELKDLNELTFAMVKTVEEGFGIMTDKVEQINGHANDIDERTENIEKKIVSLTNLVNETVQEIRTRMISIEYRLDRAEMIGIL